MIRDCQRDEQGQYTGMAQPRKTALFPVSTHVAKEPITHLRELPAEAFAYPFYDDGVMHCAAGSPLVDMRDVEDTQPAPQLSVKAFVFHVGHCGSTLLAQMLSASEACRVISEPEAINGVLLSHLLDGYPRYAMRARLAKLIDLFCARLDPCEDAVVFKMASWTAQFIPDFQALFPEAKLVFIDRDLETVTASLVDHGNGFVNWWDMPSDTLKRAVLPKGVTPSSKAEYVREMVRAARAHAVHLKQAGLWLTYPDFIDSFEAEILPALGLNFSAEALSRAQARKAHNAKALSFDREKQQFKPFSQTEF